MRRYAYSVFWSTDVAGDRYDLCGIFSSLEDLKSVYVRSSPFTCGR
jgi:hypothetical protein